MTRVKSVKLVKLVKISNFGAVDDDSDKGKIGKISNFGATGDGSNKVVKLVILVSCRQRQ